MIPKKFLANVPYTNEVSVRCTLSRWNFLKKAQLKTGETIIVLIIFFILLAGGMVFYARIHIYTTAQKAEEYQALDAAALDQRIRHLAEIACTIDATVQFDCYDLSKLHALQTVIEEHPLYYKSAVFQNAQVTVTSVYPVADSFVLYENVPEESTGATPYRTPATLYDPLTDSYNFGYVTIEVYT